nr:uncharacterized protein LOC127303656 [Lolium perenne]
MPVVTITDNDERAYSSDSEDDTEYMPHSEDSGEDSEVVELRKHARKFNKRMRDSKSWINSNAPVPVDLIANMEEQIGDEEKDWHFESSDEDYSYDEESDGHIVRKKSKYARFNTESENTSLHIRDGFQKQESGVQSFEEAGTCVPCRQRPTPATSSSTPPGRGDVLRPPSLDVPLVPIFSSLWPSTSLPLRPRAETLAPQTSPAPPLHATPRSAEQPWSSAATPQSSSDHQRTPRRLESGESSSARAADLRLPPAFPATSGLAVELHTLVVSFSAEWRPSPSRLLPPPAPHRAPAPAPSDMVADHAPATQNGRRHHQKVARVALHLFPSRAPSIGGQIVRFELNPSSQGAHGVADVIMTSCPRHNSFF